jgi:hypothetical protein
MSYDIMSYFDKMSYFDITYLLEHVDFDGT